jgi:hypothetical protein
MPVIEAQRASILVPQAAPQISVNAMYRISAGHGLT